MTGFVMIIVYASIAGIWKRISKLEKKSRKY
jgi:hypothetical protein